MDKRLKGVIRAIIDPLLTKLRQDIFGTAYNDTIQDSIIPWYVSRLVRKQTQDQIITLPNGTTVSGLHYREPQQIITTETDCFALRVEAQDQNSSGLVVVKSGTRNSAEQDYYGYGASIHTVESTDPAIWASVRKSNIGAVSVEPFVLNVTDPVSAGVVDFEVGFSMRGPSWDIGERDEMFAVYSKYTDVGSGTSTTEVTLRGLIDGNPTPFVVTETEGFSKGGIKVDGFKLTKSAAAGALLVSVDEYGNAEWRTIEDIGISGGGGAGVSTYNDGTLIAHQQLELSFNGRIQTSGNGSRTNVSLPAELVYEDESNTFTQANTFNGTVLFGDTVTFNQQTNYNALADFNSTTNFDGAATFKDTMRYQVGTPSAGKYLQCSDSVGTFSWVSLPAFARTDQANTWTASQTFSSAVSLNGITTFGGIAAFNNTASFNDPVVMSDALRISFGTPTSGQALIAIDENGNVAWGDVAIPVGSGTGLPKAAFRMRLEYPIGHPSWYIVDNFVHDWNAANPIVFVAPTLDYDNYTISDSTWKPPQGYIHCVFHAWAYEKTGSVEHPESIRFGIMRKTSGSPYTIMAASQYIENTSTLWREMTDNTTVTLTDYTSGDYEYAAFIEVSTSNPTPSDCDLYIFFDFSGFSLDNEGGGGGGGGASYINDLGDVTISGVQDNQFLRYDSTSGKWINETANFSQALNDLTDVVITSPATDQILKYNGTSWVNSTGGGGGSSNLTDLGDVTITTPSNNQLLRYNGSQWVNATVTTALNDLSDVTITSVANNHYLKYNGSQWVNEEFPDSSTQYRTLGWYADGAVTNTNAFGPIYKIDRASTIVGFAANVKTSPSSTCTLDVQVSTDLTTWNSIFSSKPTITTGNKASSAGSLNSAYTSLTTSHYIRFDINAHGSSQDLTAQVTLTTP